MSNDKISKQKEAERKKQDGLNWERDLTKYAKETEQLMRRTGCVLKGDALIPEKYMILQPSLRVKNSKKLVWSKHFAGLEKMWDAIKDKMFELHIPLALHPGIGFYIGHSGDQLGLVAMSVSNAITRLQKSLNHIAASTLDGEILEGGESAFLKYYKDSNTQSIVEATRHVLNAVQSFDRPFQPNFELHLLLSQGDEPNSDD